MLGISSRKNRDREETGELFFQKGQLCVTGGVKLGTSSPNGGTGLSFQPIF